MAESLAKRANKNRKVRQEALREQLEANGHLSQVIENVNKLQNQDIELDQNMVNRLKIANDAHLKLINKYLPDLKSVEAEVTGDMGVTIKVMEYGHHDSK